jgi:hypothetical protein
MSGETWRLLEWFSSNESSMRFALNSNLGAKRDLIDRLVGYIKRIPKFHLYTSNESLGAQAEYIRDGLVWSEWRDNVERILEEARPEGFHVMCTINALCLESLDGFLDLIMTWKHRYHGQQLSFTLNILRFPSFQSPLVLSDDLRTQHRDRIQTWLDRNIHDSKLTEMEADQVRRLIDYLDVVKTPYGKDFNRDLSLGDFKRFYQQYDQRRGKDFVSAFPSLANWYLGIE